MLGDLVAWGKVSLFVFADAEEGEEGGDSAEDGAGEEAGCDGLAGVGWAGGC